MELEEILAKVRDHYLAGYRRAIASYRARFTPGGPEVLLEIERNSPLVYRYYRMDLASGSTTPPNMTEVNLDTHLEFNPFQLNYNELQVVVAPLVWNGVECRVAPAFQDDSRLQTWALRWLDPSEGAPADNDGLGAYIHSITAPEHDATVTVFSVDFGSAPIRSVMELLTVLRDSGARLVELHSRTMLGAKS